MSEYILPTFDVNLNSEGFVIDIDSLYEFLCRLKDSRHARGVRYALVTILVCVVLAKLCGEDRLAGIADWVRHRKEALAAALHLKKVRAPHRTTYSRILGRIVNVEEFDHVMREFFEQQSQTGQGVIVTLDGKTVRGTIPAGQTRGLHQLAAFMPDTGFVLVQVEVGCRENEIVAAPRVLKCIDLQGKIVTGDAMLAQRHLSVQIVASGGDYVWTVKDNQSQLRQDIETVFEPERCVKGFSPAVKDFRSAQTTEKSHGRLEQRTLTVCTALKGYLDWPDAEQVFKLERHFERRRDGKVTHEVAYGITSLTAQAASPRRLLEMVRTHWQIENGLHYRRDETFREDWCHLRVGHAAQIMTAINNLVLGLLLRRGVKNVPEARRAYAANWDHALQLILCRSG
jgi:predicted transposase YbfD/YdcC